jgi:subtilisin family serine protease
LLTENDETQALEDEITAMKGQIVGRGDSQIDVLIPWSVVVANAREGKTPEELLSRLSQASQVRGVLPMDRPSIHQKGTFGAASGKSEGVRVTRADQWQQAGFRGAGVKVGILDPEVSKAPRYIGNVLPANTTLFPGPCVNASGASVDDEGLHGVAAAEIIHEMAPDAQLYVACSLGDDSVAIKWLQSAGVRIISYSAGGIYGQRNGKGSSQNRIDQLAKSGILWVNAAGNDGKNFHRGTLTGGPPNYWHAFAPGKTAMSFRTKGDPDIKVTLIWNQWNNLSVSDYELYIFDSQMNELGRSANNNTVLRQPMETVSAKLRANTSYFVGIRGGSSSTKGAPFILNIHNAGSIEFPVPSGSLDQPADAVGAFTVGAVAWDTDVIADYSSRGPTEDGRLKPEISAPTQITNLVYKGNFAGTSSAAPHVSGAAALVWGRYPQMSRNDVAAFLTQRARDLGPPGPDNDYGAGRLDLGDPGTATPPSPTVAAGPTATTRPGTTPTARPTATPTARPVTPTTPTTPEHSGNFATIATVLGLGAVGGIALVAGVVTFVVTSIHRSQSRPAPPTPFALVPPTPPPAAPPPIAQRSPWPPAPPPTPWTPAPSPPAYDPPGPGRTIRPDNWPSVDTSYRTPGQPWTASLQFLSGPQTGQILVLYPGLITIGRTPENTICVPSSTVTSHHAHILVNAQGCTLVDLHSTNGTYVNEQRIQQHFLQPNDLITIGPLNVRFEVKVA